MNCIFPILCLYLGKRRIYHRVIKCDWKGIRASLIIAILWHGTIALAMGQVCCVQYVQWPVHVYCSVQADCTGLPDLDPRERRRYLSGQRNSQGTNLKRGVGGVRKHELRKNTISSTLWWQFLVKFLKKRKVVNIHSAELWIIRIYVKKKNCFQTMFCDTKFFLR